MHEQAQSLWAKAMSMNWNTNTAQHHQEQEQEQEQLAQVCSQAVASPLMLPCLNSCITHSF